MNFNWGGVGGPEIYAPHTVLNGKALNVCVDIFQQMCVESGELLDIDSNQIFTPLTLKPNCQPLSGCVLSIRLGFWTV